MKSSSIVKRSPDSFSLAASSQCAICHLPGLFQMTLQNLQTGNQTSYCLCARHAQRSLESAAAMRGVVREGGRQ